MLRYDYRRLLRVYSNTLFRPTPRSPTMSFCLVPLRFYFRSKSMATLRSFNTTSDFRRRCNYWSYALLFHSSKTVVLGVVGADVMFAPLFNFLLDNFDPCRETENEYSINFAYCLSLLNFFFDPCVYFVVNYEYVAVNSCTYRQNAETLHSNRAMLHIMLHTTFFIRIYDTIRYDMPRRNIINAWFSYNLYKSDEVTLQVDNYIVNTPLNFTIDSLVAFEYNRCLRSLKVCNNSVNQQINTIVTLLTLISILQ